MDLGQRQMIIVMLNNMEANISSIKTMLSIGLDELKHTVHKPIADAGEMEYCTEDEEKQLDEIFDVSQERQEELLREAMSLGEDSNEPIMYEDVSAGETYEEQ